MLLLQQLVDVLFCYFDLGLGDLDLLVDLEEDIRLVGLELFVYRAEFLVDGLEVVNEALFLLAKVLETLVELVLLLEEVLVVEEKVFLLAADVEAFVLRDHVVR